MRIKFTASGFCSAVGNFAPGDFAVLSDDIARHLVEEAKCAAYDEVVTVDIILPAPEQPANKRRKS